MSYAQPLKKERFRQLPALGSSLLGYVAPLASTRGCVRTQRACAATTPIPQGEDLHARPGKAIRERAYHLWIADGCRDGNAGGHWLIAQREILASSLEGFGR